MKGFRILPKICSGLFAAGVLMSTSATAQVDLLELPAPPSVNATRSLLLDVQRVGTDLFAVGEFGQVLSSKDNAGSWQAAKVPVSITLTAISFADQVNGFAVGHDGVVLRTEDQGQTWSKILDGNRINEFIVQAAKDRVKLLEQRLEDVPDSDPDTQEDVSVRLENAQFSLDIAMGDVDVGPSKPLMDVLALRGGLVFAAGAYGQLIRSQDGGRTWQYLGGRLNNPDGYHLNAILQTRDGSLYVAGEQGRVFLSTDQGDTWRNVSIAYDGSIFSLVQSPKTGSVVALGLRGNVFRLPEGTDDWQTVETNLNETFSGATVLNDGSIVLVGARGIMAKSDDDLKSIQVARRPDKLPTASVIQLNSEVLLVAGLKGLRQIELDIFK